MNKAQAPLIAQTYGEKPIEPIVCDDHSLYPIELIAVYVLPNRISITTPPNRLAQFIMMNHITSDTLINSPMDVIISIANDDPWVANDLIAIQGHFCTKDKRKPRTPPLLFDIIEWLSDDDYPCTSPSSGCDEASQDLSEEDSDYAPGWDFKAGDEEEHIEDLVQESDIEEYESVDSLLLDNLPLTHLHHNVRPEGDSFVTISPQAVSWGMAAFLLGYVLGGLSSFSPHNAQRPHYGPEASLTRVSSSDSLSLSYAPFESSDSSAEEHADPEIQTLPLVTQTCYSTLLVESENWDRDPWRNNVSDAGTSPLVQHLTMIDVAVQYPERLDVGVQTDEVAHGSPEATQKPGKQVMQAPESVPPSNDKHKKQTTAGTETENNTSAPSGNALTTKHVIFGPSTTVTDTDAGQRGVGRGKGSRTEGKASDTRDFSLLHKRGGRAT